MHAKGWQKVVIAVGLVIGASLIVWNVAFAGQEGADLADSVVLIDVTSGKAYRANPARMSLTFPDRCPETDRYNLVPIVNEDGKWRVSERRMGAIAQCQGEVKAVDSKTGEVLVEVRDIRTFRRRAQ